MFCRCNENTSYNGRPQSRHKSMGPSKIGLGDTYLKYVIFIHFKAKCLFHFRICCCSLYFTIALGNVKELTFNNSLVTSE